MPQQNAAENPASVFIDFAHSNNVIPAQAGIQSYFFRPPQDFGFRASGFPKAVC
jgi:hypothetical protein